MALTARFGYRTKDVRRSECTAAESVGDFVCIVDDPPNGVDYVGKADPADFDKMPAVGVIISKSTPTDCIVQWMGETPNIFGGLSSGEIYYLGSDAKIAEVPPVPVATKMFVQPDAVATAPTRADIKAETNLARRIP